MAKYNYANYTHSQLVEEIKKLNKRKKYGLVWEEEKTKEKFEAESEGKLPVLVEVKKREIITDDENPTHILIEGDNYHALSVLNYTHSKSIDVIYSDPPYNTGNNDFKYNDKFVDREDSYRHSKWLSFMSKRLKLAKSLLKNSGVIFISINDIEQAQLKLLCDDIFNEDNFLANLVWQNKEGGGSSDSKYFRVKHEYILTYAKKKESVEIIGDDISNLDRYKEQDKHEKKRGPYYLQKLGMGSIQYSDSLDYPIKTPDDTQVLPRDNNKGKKACWRWSRKKLEWGIENDFIVFKKDKEQTWQVYTKQYLYCDNEGNLIERTQRPFGVIDKFSSTQASKEIREIDVKPFSYPKPKDLITYLISKHPNKSAIIADFMAGSGTTGQAVIELNNSDNGDRQFILITNNEANICTDVCYPRIKKVIKGYKNTKGEAVDGLGGNLKYYKTNFISSEPTHRNKKLLTEKSIDMLCIKENTFDEVLNQNDISIFKNQDKYTAILFNEMKITEFKKEIIKLKLPVSVYVFSLEGDDFSEDFQDIKNEIKFCSIPEAILKVYRRIYETSKPKK